MKQNTQPSKLCYISQGKFSYQENNLIGKGATGNVYKGIDHSNNKSVAIKVINTNSMNQIERNLIQNQKKALKMIKHENIMKLVHIENQKGYTFIISQIYEGGSLQNYLKNNGRFSENEALQFFRKIINGYCSVVQANIIHRDLKPANILLTNSKQPIIIDFGYSQIIIANKNLTVFNVGSPSYMAPQAYNRTIYSEKSDIWSLGVILYQLITCSTLDDGQPIKNYFKSLEGLQFPPIKFQKFGAVIQQILKGSLAIAPQKRITCHKIKYILDKQIIGKKLCKKNFMNAKQNQAIFSNIHKKVDFASMGSDSKIKKDQSSIKMLLNKAPLNFSSANQIWKNKGDLKQRNKGLLKSQVTSAFEFHNQNKVAHIEFALNDHQNTNQFMNTYNFRKSTNEYQLSQQKQKNALSSMKIIGKTFQRQEFNQKLNLALSFQKVKSQDYDKINTNPNSYQNSRKTNVSQINQMRSNFKNATYNQGFYKRNDKPMIQNSTSFNKSQVNNNHKSHINLYNPPLGHNNFNQKSQISYIPRPEINLVTHQNINYPQKEYKDYVNRNVQQVSNLKNQTYNYGMPPRSSQNKGTAKKNQNKISMKQTLNEYCQNNYPETTFKMDKNFLNKEPNWSNYRIDNNNYSNQFTYQYRQPTSINNRFSGQKQLTQKNYNCLSPNINTEQPLKYQNDRNSRLPYTYSMNNFHNNQFNTKDYNYQVNYGNAPVYQNYSHSNLNYNNFNPLHCNLESNKKIISLRKLI